MDLGHQPENNHHHSKGFWFARITTRITTLNINHHLTHQNRTITHLPTLTLQEPKPRLLASRLSSATPRALLRLFEMTINWFPGHMNKARREISAAMRETDVVIEVLDARLPAASANPMLEELRAFYRVGTHRKLALAMS